MCKGFKGLWDKLTGTSQRTRAKNEKEAQQNYLRDRKEMEKLITSQLSERKKLQNMFEQVRQKHASERSEFIKGMSKHYQKIERHADIRQTYNKEKDSLGRTIENDPTYEPEM